MESKSREEAFKDFASGGRYSKVKAIFLEPGVKATIGPLNAEFINALPDSCGWIGYKGAGYDGVAFDACKARGTFLLFVDISPLAMLGPMQ
jgi:glyoxylate reductase